MVPPTTSAEVLQNNVVLNLVCQLVCVMIYRCIITQPLQYEYLSVQYVYPGLEQRLALNSNAGIVVRQGVPSTVPLLCSCRGCAIYLGSWCYGHVHTSVSRALLYPPVQTLGKPYINKTLEKPYYNNKRSSISVPRAYL